MNNSKTLNRKTSVRNHLFATALISGLFGLLSISTLADTTLYEISKGKQKLYLGGTIHFLKAEDLPPPAEFDAAFEKSEKLVVETDMNNAQSPEFAKKFQQAMILPNNQTLRDVLNEATWKKLQDYAVKNNYPLSQTMIFNAAFNSIILTVTELQKLPVAAGVDSFYYQKATAANKTLGELETGDQAIDAILAFNQDDPNEIIEQTLEDIGSAKENFASMVAAWKTGDLNTLEKKLSEKMRAHLPKAYRALVTNRNNLWLPQIETMLKTPEVELVLVGSLHLAGDDGLLALLKKDGYTVKPFHLRSSSKQ